MKFTIKKTEFTAPLLSVLSAVEKKITIPVLGSLLIESTGDDKIRITGTDLDITVQVTAPATVTESGSVCVPAQKLFEIVQRFDGDEIGFEPDTNGRVKLSCGKARFVLATRQREDFPVVPSFNADSARLPAHLLNELIKLTSFAIATEASRFSLSGAQLTIENQKARMVATDGYRLTLADRELIAENAAVDTLIPKKALAVLARLTQNSEAEVRFGEDENHLYFQIGESRSLISRKLSGTFPAYEKLLPDSPYANSVTFDAQEMLAAVGRIALVADEQLRTIQWAIRDGEIIVTANNADTGAGNESVTAQFTGDERVFGFGIQFLTEFLNAVPYGQVTLEFADDAARFVIFTSDSSVDYRYLLMPRRV